MSDPFVSVIVPHYHDLGRLQLCLQALELQTYDPARFEVIVADNGSPEGEAAVATAIGKRGRLTLAQEKGAGPARNAGAAAARGQVFAFTDADCLPAPGWLKEGVAALEAYDFVGGAMEVLVEDPARMTSEEAFETVFAFDNETYVRKKGFTVTANLFCRRDVFAAAGGFRAGVSEDLEWSGRARAKGFRIGYAAKAVVGHPARRNWSELQGKWRRLSAEAFLLCVEQPGGRMRWFVRCLLLPLSAVAHTPKVLTSHKLASGAQRVGALAALYRLRLWRCADGLRLLRDL
jgi:glycosyltransferase involved in cell wall biosynthesis